MAHFTKYPVIEGEKECSLCGKMLPIVRFSVAKKHYSSRCKDCLNEYAKKRRSLPEEKKKISDYHKNYKKNPENREKINARQRLWNKKPKSRVIKNEQRKKWTLNEKRKSIAYKGGKCIICGYNKCEAALEFHHINPENKIGIKDHLSFENSRAELDKCVLLCCRCHREFHQGLITL